MNYVYPNNSSGSLQEAIIAQAEGVDFGAIGNTALYTVPIGSSLITTKALIFLDNSMGLTGTMEAGIGFNGTADNIIPSGPLTGFNDTPQQIYTMLVQNVTYIAQGGDMISFGIDTPFGGTVQGSIVLFGIEVNE